MKILLVEDDRDLSNAIVRVLGFNKIDVDAVYNGLEALEYLEVTNYDGIIMDVMMPKLDGISTLKQLRAKGNNVPVLMLTAKAETDDKVNGLDAGADDYLTKPFIIKELLARIRAITRRKYTHIVQKFEMGGLCLDKETYELKYNDKSVRLTNKEFRIMELLLSNKNILLSTEKIMENVWQYDSEAEINVVWVFISSIRKKLETIGANYIIKAVRGVGYRLEATTSD